MQSIIRTFFENIGIPQITGAIDGCKIECKAPEENKEDYFDRTHSYSVNLQAIVDASPKFLDISEGYPGSLHDARVLELSPFCIVVENGEIMAGPIQRISGVSVGPLLAGDSAYPLRSCVGLTIRNAEYLLYTLLLTTKSIYCQ